MFGGCYTYNIPHFFNLYTFITRFLSTDIRALDPRSLGLIRMEYRRERMRTHKYKIEDRKERWTESY